jgi:thymidylate synthase (FAD)
MATARTDVSQITDIYGDGIGYVTLLDSMGDDFTPAEDARTSTDKGRLGPEKDKALQERLMRDSHTSPFEGVVVKFELCVPLFVLRELDRHRTLDKTGEDDPFELVGPEENMRKWFSRNEMSGRYIQMPDLYYHPVEVRSQSKSNKQGGGNALVSSEVAREFKERGIQHTKAARELYTWAVEQGIEKGLARIYNTQNQYTRIRYTGSLKNWFDALYLRLPSVVLWECRQPMEAIEALLTERFPEAMSSWKKLVYNSVRLGEDELDVVLWALNAMDQTSLILSEESKAKRQRLIERIREKMK